MPEVTLDHYLPRPIDVVWNYVGDVDLHPLWQSDLKLDEIVSGDGTAGSTGREQRVLWGVTQNSTYEVTAFEAPRRWGFRSISSPVPMSGTIDLVEEGEGTRIHVLLTFSGWAGGVLTRYASSRFTGYLRELDALLTAPATGPSAR